MAVNDYDEDSETIRDTEDESSESDRESQEGDGLLDLMAAESDGDSGDTSEEEDFDHERSPQSYFHPFIRLPPELRRRIWEIFCPDLEVRSRILDFIASPGTARHPAGTSGIVWTVKDGIFLEDQTRPLRSILAVHQESRAIALQVFPDTLRIDAGSGDAIVRFNKDADLVLVHGLQGVEPTDAFYLTGFAEHVKSIAIGDSESFDTRDFNISTDLLSDFLSSFSHLRDLFFCYSSAVFRKQELKWCTSELVNRFYAETFEKEPGLGEDLQILYCWPDLRNHLDFAKFHIPTPERQEHVFSNEGRIDGLSRWPMIAFEFKRGISRYKLIREKSDILDAGDGSDESDLTATDEESVTDLDQYESDGIDDGVLETFGSSDDDDDEISDHHSDRSEARFSSPESEPESAAAEAQETLVRRRKRPIVSDSEDESDDEAQPTNKRVRVSRVVSSESEPENESAASSGHRQVRAVLLDSGEGSEDDSKNPSPMGSESEQSSRSGSSESNDGGDDDADVPSKPLSLAERLRLHRQRHPVASSEDGSHSGSDDEEDEDEDEEDESGFDSEGGVVLTMAAESGDEEEEDYDDDY